MVLGYFRQLSYFLSIIRYLSNDYKIGLYAVDILNEQKHKNIENQKNFENTCSRLGATIIRREKIKTELLLIQQNIYLKSSCNEINENIIAKSKIGILGFAWAGIKEHDLFLDIFNINKIFVIDKNFTEFLLNERDVKVYKEKHIIETGIPFKKYPLFEDLVIDYFLVMPTAFSFPHEKDKWDFLETLRKLFSEIDHRDIIVHKAHNGMYADQFVSKKCMQIIKIIRYLPFLSHILKWIINNSPIILSKYLSKLYTAYLYGKILKRTTPLNSISKHSYLGVEAFFPFVRKGVIGGLSNTIWGAIYHKLPFYNAVDISKQNRFGSDKIYGKKDTTNLIDLNLKYFNVPFCDNKL